MKHLGATSLLSCALLSLANLGCHDWVAIRPTELPRLNGSTAVQVGTTTQYGPNGTTSTAPVMAVSQTAVEGPDGRMVQINGSFDARVVSGGEERTFDGPVVSELQLEGRQLNIRSANYAPVDIPISAVDSVEVSQFNAVKTSLLSGGLGIIGGTLIAIVLLSAI